MATFGGEIRRLRREKELTQRDLARLAGIDATYLSKIENDRLDGGQTPREQTIRRLAEVLDADPETLLLRARRIPDALRTRLLSRPDLFGVLSWLDERKFGALLDGLDEAARDAAGRALCEAHAFLQDVLDALVQHIAVLNDAGVIVAVNAAWRAFATGNGLAPQVCSEGTDYLRVCDEAEGPWSEGAREVAVAIRRALRGAAEPFEMRYPCHSPERPRWFVVRVTSFGTPGSRHVVVTHDDVTGRIAPADGIDGARS